MSLKQHYSVALCTRTSGPQFMASDTLLRDDLLKSELKFSRKPKVSICPHLVASLRTTGHQTLVFRWIYESAATDREPTPDVKDYGSSCIPHGIRGVTAGQVGRHGICHFPVRRHVPQSICAHDQDVVRAVLVFIQVIDRYLWQRDASEQVSRLYSSCCHCLSLIYIKWRKIKAA